MARIVMKFGGTSMAGIERIRAVAQRVVTEARAGNQVLVVVSAMAGETDRLVQFCKEAAASHDPREYDVVVASGEQVTAGLLAMTLQNEGLMARSFMGWQLVRASGVHGDARVDSIEASMLGDALDRGMVCVIPGFQGATDDGRVATLGRGGSDTSAVAIAAGVKADRCDIYTDVDGIYTTDPRIEPKAGKLAAITFEEMLELAGAGAKVLQVRSVGLAMRENMPLRVLSAFEEKDGTRIVARLEDDMERSAIAGIAADKNDALIRLTGVPSTPGILADILGPLGDAGIATDMIAAGAGDENNALSFTVPKSHLGNALNLLGEYQNDAGYTGIQSEETIAKLSIVGIGLRSDPTLAAKMFATLADRKINVRGVSSSEIRLSTIIAADDVDVAVRALHAAFDLGDAS